MDLAAAMASSMAGNVCTPLRRMRTRLPVRTGDPVIPSTKRANSGVPGWGGSSTWYPARPSRR